MSRLTYRQREAWQAALFCFPILLVAIFEVLRIGIQQDQLYHAFADHRTLLGIPNFWNVVSNLPFAMVGLMGLRAFRDLPSRLLFLGVCLVAFGSAYYHLAPDDARLVWDRLPMTVAFMALLAIVIRVRTWGLIALIAYGIASVAWWKFTGDLLPYGVAQFGPMLVIVVLMFTGRTRGLWLAVLCYALAKVAELEDAWIYAHSGFGGHAIKHLLAAAATYAILRWRSIISL